MERKYTKDPATGAVIFHDSDAYAKRKNVLANQKATKVGEKDNRKVINSLRSEISELKNLVNQLIGPGEL